MRIEIYYKKAYTDGRAPHLAESLKLSVSPLITAVDIIDVYMVSGVDDFGEREAREIFTDPVAQNVLIDRPAAEEADFSGWRYLIEVAYKAGVTDPVAITAREAIEIGVGRTLPEDAVVQTARQYLVHTRKAGAGEEKKLVNALHNPLIQQARFLSSEEWNAGKRLPDFYPHVVAPSSIEVRRIELRGLDEAALVKMSKERLLALTADEMRSIQQYYSDSNVQSQRRARGISEEATDVELEMIAQTWSEHCKHKIFQANIRYREGGREERISSLFKEYIRKTTEELSEKKGYLRSVFHDNSGVVRFDEDTLVCFKVETHNSPSALDPYGGAITGIVGVNRDIMGTGKGARPVFNTNVLCFGMPDTPEEEIPEGLLHPRRVMAGVHQGIIDGGNQSGIPVVGGAFLFDRSFTGKPLVFCGTGGVLPAEINGEASWIKHTNPGDLVVMTGGRIGKDGIHGATFSSLALDETSPTSAVQIGDPITQKKMLDFLLEARDRGLYNGITDNGAGGLSSSLGEMAQTPGGVKIELDKCPLKYQGLAPWEILVSESQERMSLSVPPEKAEEFLALAKMRDVEATVIGEFTGTGNIEIFYDGRLVGLLSLEFLHEGLPAMELEAEWEPPLRQIKPSAAARQSDGEQAPGENSAEYTAVLYRLLSEPNIASKEELVRRYDHEVQAGSVMKPFIGSESDGPSDGAVFRPVYDSPRGVTVTHGICPKYSEIDTYHMAMCAVDEAYRAHVACGGDPEEASALDNFCWPDPVESTETPDGKYKLAQLVRACRGLKEACTAYGLPLISGKDSMKNDARIGGKKVSVKPTLLVSLMGIIRDIRKTVTSDFKSAGDVIYLLGETKNELAGSFYETVTGGTEEEVPKVNLQRALPLYRALHSAMDQKLVASCHDISDGGFAVALAESALAGRLGAEVDLSSAAESGPAAAEGEAVTAVGSLSAEALLFSETPSRFVATVKPADTAAFEAELQGLPVYRVGTVKKQADVVIRRSGRILVEAELKEIISRWKREGAAW